MADSAPLVSTPQAPVPPGGEAEWIKGAGAGQLRAAIFRPEGRARGSVILSGGRAEFIEKYYETIADLTARGFVVLAHDWRGQGLSSRELGDRLKGHANGYKAYLDDYRALLSAFEERLPKPWLAVGHSMGGCLALLAVAHGERRFAGMLLSAPMLGINPGRATLRQAKVGLRAAKIFRRLHRYLPGQAGDPFGSDFEANILTHDRARFLRTCGLIAAEPQLALGGPTWGWLDFALRATAYLARPDRLREITIPVIILQAEDDRLVDNAAQDAAARHLPQGKLIRVPGAFHEILMETDPMRDMFKRAFDALMGRAAPKPAEAPKPASAAAPAAHKPAEPPKPAPAPAPMTAAAAKAEAKPAAAKKPAARKPAAKKAAAPAKAAAAKADKPATAKKPAAKKPASKKPAAAKKAAAPKATAPKAAKKPAAKPAAAKKPAVAKKPAAAKAPAAKATAPKKPAAAKKPAVKKPAAKKPAAKASTVTKAAAATTGAPKTAKAAAKKKPAAKKA